jgi:hypothetical protein
VFARSELNGWLAGFLAEHVDDVLRGAGFSRRAGARSARRRTAAGSQKLEFLLFSRPPYAPEMAHLYLNVTLHMPELTDLTRRIFGAEGPEGSLAAGAALDSLPNHPAELWLFRERAALDDLAPSVREALATCVLPFLDASGSVTGLVDGPARECTRVQVVAAAYVHLGRREEAVEYLRGRLGDETGRAAALLTPQVREAQKRRHAEALARLESYLAPSS